MKASIQILKAWLSEGVTLNLEYRHKSVRKVWTIYKKTPFNIISFIH